jgi:hypothetical protein
MVNSRLMTGVDRTKCAKRRYVPWVKLVGLTLFCAVLLGACSSHATSTPPASTVPPIDVTTSIPTSVADNAQTRHQIAVTSCGTDTAGHVEIKGTAHNPTSSTVSYALQLTIRDPSANRFYATATTANDVAPAHTAKWEVATTAPYHAGVECAVASATKRAP